MASTAADKKFIRDTEKNIEKMKKNYKAGKDWFGKKITKKTIADNESLLKKMKKSLK